MERTSTSARTESAVFSSGSLGEWCVRHGLATEQQVRECLQLQREDESAGRIPPRLGELLVRKGLLSPQQVSEALAEQQTEIRYCPRCRIRVNVSLRSDAVWYRCSRCQGPLASPQILAQVDVVDESAIVVSSDPVPLDVQVAARIPGRRFGKYILLRELGSGGVGSVHQAWDTYLSQYVALKRLRGALKGETTELVEKWTTTLIQEARHSIRLRHPGIVSTFDVGRIDKEYYIAMEYLQGETLHEQMEASRSRGKPSPFYEHPKQALRLLSEIARAVHHAHTRPTPVIHCDLKPGNILVDPEGRAHVFDFGLSRNPKPGSSEDGEVSGTPSYMAPEQASGRTGDIDARTDIWAMGAILYEMLTGRPPFVGQPFEVIHRTITELPRSPREALDETTRKISLTEVSTRMLLQIPPFLEALCMRCLNREQDLRPATMEEFAAALEQGMTKSQQDARPSPAPEEAPRQVPAASPPRRRGLRPLAFAAALLALAYPAYRLAVDAPPAPDAEVAERIAAFRPDLALPIAQADEDRARGTPSAPGAARTRREVELLARLQNRVVESLSRSPMDLPELRLRSQTLQRVRIVRAELAGLGIAKEERTWTVAWSDLEPSQIVGLARLALVDPDESDRMGLGLYCWKAGRTADAREYFESLPRDSAARGYLSELEKR